MNARVFLALCGALVVGTSAPLAAQGVLSSQGLGFPPGQLSTHARGTGGAIAEFDPVSALNPAAMAGWGRAAIHVQSEPETRRTTSPGGTDITGSTRFSMIAAGIGLGDRVAVGFNVSTFLDRSWETIFEGTQIIGPDTARFTDRNGARGAIADSKVIVGVNLPLGFRVGLGAHAISGSHQLRAGRQYAAESPYVGFSTSQQLRFVGRALSTGVSWEPVRWLAVAGSARFGGGLEAINDAQQFRAQGAVPDRFGVAVRAEVAQGLQVAARRERVQWSALAPLVESNIPVSDSDETSVGFEYLGNASRAIPYFLRLGTSGRTLPFGLATGAITERTVAGGLGILLAQGRFGVDLTYASGRRSAPGAIAERAGTFSLGLIIRP